MGILCNAEAGTERKLLHPLDQARRFPFFNGIEIDGLSIGKLSGRVGLEAVAHEASSASLDQRY